jgi:Rrf2 family protein
MMALARHYPDKTVKIRDVASEENLPEKFLELILLELRNARMVESVRGAKGGYRLRRPPSDIPLSAIMRLIDGPLAPFGDADQLRSLIARDVEHRALYQVFLDVRDAAATILDNTTVADLIDARKGPGPRHVLSKRLHRAKSGPASASVKSKSG